MIMQTDPLESAPASRAQFTLRRQAARAGQVIVRALALPERRARRSSYPTTVPVQFTETSFTPRINHPAQ
jgi:hypothetical protein